MPAPRLRRPANLLFVLSLAAATPALAQEEAANTRTAPSTGASQRFDQVLYKGVVGNLLDAVPMDADQRTALQRTNAVVSGAVSGKSLATLAKLAHPGFLIGGLAWGLWAASNIEPAPGGARLALAAAPATDAMAPAAGELESPPALAHAAITPAAAVAQSARPKVVRVWLAPSAVY
jgi:hypothetical protein